MIGESKNRMKARFDYDAEDDDDDDNIDDDDDAIDDSNDGNTRWLC